VEIRALAEDDRGWVERFIRARWGAPEVARRGQLVRPAQLPGFAAFDNDEAAGLVTYAIDGENCEIVTIDSVTEGQGVGTALLEAVAGTARHVGCRRLWLVTTNDNLRAQHFYERHGFTLVAVHRGAVAEARGLKPEIPLVGAGGVPIVDELEFELLL
jgi:ribosomal protein S18 acetylase RimI-like enzyme